MSTQQEVQDQSQQTTSRGEPFEYSPLPWKTSFAQWWKSPNAEVAERRVLSYLPFFPESDGTRSARVNSVDIGQGLHLNEFEITNHEPSEEEKGWSGNMVVLHGYGAGLGLFFQNFDAWSMVKGSKTFALDLLGFGRSSRPKFEIATKRTDELDDQGRFKAVVETEDWFIDALEAWRQRKQIERFTLMGHSMGGYLAAAYAFRYPQHVERLVMVSPAGVERGYSPELEHKSLFKSSNKIMRESDMTAVADGVDIDTTTTRSSTPDDELYDEKSGTVRQLPNTLMYLWNSHVSPFSILQMMGFMGPRFISKWTYRRFSHLPANERSAMHDYVYKIFTAKSSGEYAITRLLAPGAVARMPLVDRVASQVKCPSIWIYGENDWMNMHAGDEACKRLRREGRMASHHVVRNAGHHVYLDNPGEFDRILVNFLNKPRKNV